MKDARVGDAVCSDPNSPRGWFVVDDVVHLTSGDLSLVGRRGQMTITADPRDIVGIQVRQDVEMADDPDYVAPAEDDVEEVGPSNAEQDHVDEAPAEAPAPEAESQATPDDNASAA